MIAPSSHRWFITGAGGMAGSDLCRELAVRDEEIVAAFTRTDLDITDAQAVASAVRTSRPTIIVNCAAYTKVDLAEREEALANAINGSAVEHLAQAANRTGATLVQISTDFVFDGAKDTPYEVTDPTGPLLAYGRSKLIGEHAAAMAEKHVIVRTAWLFGAHGPNFIEAIHGQVSKGTNPLRVVDDQRGRPTSTPHLAHALIRLARLAATSDEARGIVHYADTGECTWYDFACAIVEEIGAATKIVPVTSDQFPRPARRPKYSVLSTERYTRLTGAQPESWRDGLQEYLAARAATPV